MQHSLGVTRVAPTPWPQTSADAGLPADQRLEDGQAGWPGTCMFLSVCGGPDQAEFDRRDVDDLAVQREAVDERCLMPYRGRNQRFPDVAYAQLAPWKLKESRANLAEIEPVAEGEGPPCKATRLSLS
ncbi:hypothetical protein [Achromobacter aegrifaciens]|uniref:hypothetical protein n=1 Tax=Achromobacter aegrifaciens TaxID=1287736 RepID=UPI001582FDFB|nr:hypothetical protein [Achromobacter aegrifaciens]